MDDPLTSSTTSTTSYRDALVMAVLGMEGYPIAPMLTTSELLRMSETCVSLLPFRGQHLDIKVSGNR